MLVRVQLGLPAQPRSLNVAVTGTSARVSWRPPAAGPTLLRYELYHRVEGRTERRVIALPPGVEEALVDSLEEGVQHWFALAAVSRAGAGPESEEVRVFVGECCAVYGVEQSSKGKE